MVAGTEVDSAAATVAVALGEAVAVFGKQACSTYIPCTSSLAKIIYLGLAPMRTGDIVHRFDRCCEIRACGPRLYTRGDRRKALDIIYVGTVDI